MNPKFAKLAVASLLAALVAMPTYAQSAQWRVDSNHSSARIVVQTQPRDGGSSVTLGAAAARGTLRVDASNPANSVLEFDLYPAGSGSAAAPDDPILTTHLIFRSQNASLTPDGRLKLTGALTVSRVIREIHLEASEAYSGPVETDRVIFQSTRQESLPLPLPDVAANASSNPFLEVSTALNINAEDFPELVNGVLSANWPEVAQDRSCDFSASASEGYSGALCTGAAVESRSVNRTSAFASEGYAGGEPFAALPASVVTVALHLQFAPQTVQLSAKTGQ